MSFVNFSLLEVEASSIYFEPERRITFYEKPKSSTNVQACPAVQAYQSRSYIIRCPFDLRLRIIKNGNNLNIHIVPEFSSINSEKLKSLITISNRSEWRNIDTPVLQISTPYLFYSTENIYFSQRHPTEFDIKRLSWRLIEGEYNIGRWIRPLSWAIEWADPSKDLWLNRGDPWFIADFKNANNFDQIKILKKPLDEEIKKKLLATKDVSSYVTGTFSLQRSFNGNQDSGL